MTDTTPSLRWGVVGIGGFLERTIAPAMVEEPECTLVAATSRDRRRAEDFVDRFGAERAYESYELMLEDTGIDAVYVATPNSLHADQVVLAARAGKHVLCEKPLAINPFDAERAVAACAEAGVGLGIDFHNRFVPWVRDVTRMVADDVIGRPQLVEVDVGSGPRHYDNWRADPELAGLGTVHNVGVHALDFLTVILDSEPTEVTAVFDADPGSGGVEMLALVLLRFANGALAYCNCNERLERPTNTIDLYGTRGRITGSGLTRSRVGGTLTVLTGDDERTTSYPPVEAHRSCVAAFARAVLGGEPPSPSGLDGLRSARLCEAIRRSAQEHRSVLVDNGGG